MSDVVEMLLVRGIAALKTGLPANAEEASHCFEKVLAADDAESRQKIRAWLSLARIEQDPARRRVCFESALALDPGNAEARQGLAILDGCLKPEDIADPDKPLSPVIPEVKLSPSDARRLVCTKCGAKLLVKSDQQASVCVYCGALLEHDPPVPDRMQVKEQDFLAALPTARAHRWEYPTGRTLSCGGCGATFVLPPLQAGGACSFCGSTHVVNGSAPELIQPDAVLPFQLDRAEAARCIRRWLDDQRFCPSDLSGCAGTIEPRSAFLPFWTFDFGGTMDWRALVEHRRGKRREWVLQTGVHLAYYDDLLVPASRRITEEMSGAYTDFNTDALVPYSTELLAGYATEVYQVPLDKASVAARQLALQKAKTYEEKTSLEGKNYRDFVMNSAGMVVDSYKLVLLPLWFAGYRYRGESFSVAVNGQTGTVAGGIPRNWWQRTLASLFGKQSRRFR